MFDEFGWGKLYSKRIPRKWQCKPSDVLLMYRAYKAGIVYDNYTFSNRRIVKWLPPEKTNKRFPKSFACELGRFVADGPRKLEFFPYHIIKSHSKPWCFNDWEDDAKYWIFQSSVKQKPRTKIEKCLLALPLHPYVECPMPYKNQFICRSLKKEIRQILMSGGHVHDEHGFLLPEFELTQHGDEHPLVLNPDW